MAGSLKSPMVIAHRGGASLAPENTLAAFRNALEVGADAVELDVRLTRDRRVAVFHDRRVDRTTTGTGVVGSHTLAELKSLDAGSWFSAQFEGETVPSLEEVFEALPPDFPIFVEMKAKGPAARLLVPKVVDLVREYGRWESTKVASFNPAALVHLRLIEPRIIRGYIWSGAHPLPLLARLMSPLVKPYWLAPAVNALTPSLVARFHARGNPVSVWDVGTGKDLEELMELGLDGIVTDYPDTYAARRPGTPQRRTAE